MYVKFVKIKKSGAVLVGYEFADWYLFQVENNYRVKMPKEALESNETSGRERSTGRIFSCLRYTRNRQVMLE